MQPFNMTSKDNAMLLQKIYARHTNRHTYNLDWVVVATCHEQLVHCHIMCLPNSVHPVYCLILRLRPHTAIAPALTSAQTL